MVKAKDMKNVSFINEEGKREIFIIKKLLELKPTPFKEFLNKLDISQSRSRVLITLRGSIRSKLDDLHAHLKILKNQNLKEKELKELRKIEEKIKVLENKLNHVNKRIMR